ncbi:ArpU family transcriptional regulator [Bacillus cereus]|uniref:ArpU family transcriptional regulator n=1 Tax=Bacillus cereus TaxID=1396 RepID=UPI003D654EEB
MRSGRVIIVPFVIDELRKYRVLRIRFQNQQEKTELGVELLFPELKQVDKHELKYRQLKRAFEEAFDEDEQRILEMKYMSIKELNDDYIYTILGMRRDKFYRKRKSGIINFATALVMI